MYEKIDKLNMDFLWGDMDTKKMIYLLKWINVCKPKRNGGLGLRMADKGNLAISYKLRWQNLNEDKPMWVQGLKAK